jgi:DNA-binding NtrC family response regulator
VVQLLFGSVEGRSGWFESATGGTLLLRDLPALPRAAQERLARALAETEARSEDDSRESVPPRIVATSRTSVAELRREGVLDPDLERRLAPQALSIPSLRERREDVPSLALLAIDRACRVLARDPIGIDQHAMGALVDHDWPGDVAEFELVIELAASRAKGKTIGLADLPPLAWPTGEREDSLEGTYLEVERRLLEQALRRAGGNKSQAARRLGLKRTTFLDKLRRHGLEQRSADDVGESAVG